MSAYKNYIEDVMNTTANAMLTEAKEELTAYGDFENPADLDEYLFETVCNEGAIAVWNMIQGLIGDMEWNAEHPLLDEAKNQVLPLIPHGTLAKELAEFFNDYDPYEFRNSCSDMDEAIEANIDILNTNSEDTIEWLNGCLEEMDEDKDSDYWKEMITICKGLIDKVNLECRAS